MKTVKNTLFAAVMVIMSACAANRTSPERINEVTNKIQVQNYTIGVNYAHPMRGSQIFLNDSYELTVRNDSAIAFLPYYGQVNTAPANPVEGGIKFAERIRDYHVAQKSRGDGWDITFKVNAREYNYDFVLSIFHNGTSTITVNSVQRDPITFSGNIQGLNTQRETTR